MEHLTYLGVSSNTNVVVTGVVCYLIIAFLCMMALSWHNVQRTYRVEQRKQVRRFMQRAALLSPLFPMFLILHGVDVVRDQREQKNQAARDRQVAERKSWDVSQAEQFKELSKNTKI